MRFHVGSEVANREAHFKMRVRVHANREGTTTYAHTHEVSPPQLPHRWRCTLSILSLPTYSVSQKILYVEKQDILVLPKSVRENLPGTPWRRGLDVATQNLATHPVYPCASYEATVVVTLGRRACLFERKTREKLSLGLGKLLARSLFLMMWRYFAKSHHQKSNIWVQFCENIHKRLQPISRKPTPKIPSQACNLGGLGTSASRFLWSG